MFNNTVCYIANHKIKKKIMSGVEAGPLEELNALTASDIGDEVAMSPHENESKIKFFEELISVLKPKQNVIECRAITHAQIQKLIAIISEKDSTKRDAK